MSQTSTPGPPEETTAPSVEEECPYCSGTGDLSETVEGTEHDIGEPCPHCEGEGTVCETESTEEGSL